MWTGDGRVFFYNPKTRTSVWERPSDLLGRADVDLAISITPEQVMITVSKDNNKKEVVVRSRNRHHSNADESDVANKKVNTEFRTTGKCEKFEEIVERVGHFYDFQFHRAINKLLRLKYGLPDSVH